MSPSDARRALPRPRLSHPLVIPPAILALALLGACARTAISPEAYTASGAPSTGHGTVTTRAGTSTTRKSPPTTPPPTTIAPVTTAVGGGAAGTPKVFDVAADLSVDVKLGESFELHLENDMTSGFTWKGDITAAGATVLKATGLRTDPPADPTKPSVLAGAYEAIAPGTGAITFSQAKGDGTPGKQWKVTVNVT